MVGIYLSGTGNTKHCIEKLLSIIDTDAKTIPIESKEAVNDIIENEIIILAYPTQFSNVPYMVRDFIKKNSGVWKNKKVVCMTTMGAFSGDGAGCAARVLRKYGADIIGGIHLKMPDAVCDSKLLKKSLEENVKTVKDADQKIERIADKIIKEGRYPRDGLSVFAHLAGLFGQRLWFYNKTTNYSNKLKISDACVGCGQCVKNCPMNNLETIKGKAIAKGNCAMCYRCISTCPKQAITLLGKEVYEQCRYDKYAR